MFTSFTSLSGSKTCLPNYYQSYQACFELYIGTTVEVAGDGAQQPEKYPNPNPILGIYPKYQNRVRVSPYHIF